ncbi:MAG TPA: hypothetical protein PKH79_10360 [Prolixibacteraceae bacterium]|nr:hypothetical protein [Prolixibacteraceae bacterium]HPS13379.1 hypothetical protein [Prolixibacteraceae bacterium]
MKTQTLKKSVIFILALGLIIFFIVDMASAKENGIEKILSEGKLPSILKLKEDKPQKYLVITDYFNRDIYGNFFSKQRYRGTYSRGYSDKKVKWEKVTFETSTDEKAPFGNGSPLAYMAGFCYVPSAEMMKAESFPNFPPAEVSVKNLVWDMMGFEGFAWLYFDSLKLNVPFQARAFNGKIPMEGVGNFENKGIILTWTGVTFKNGEPCGVIEFLAMDNPLNFSFTMEQGNVEAKGRSHYWGTVLVSLTDKQLEGATLHEDVVMDVTLPGNNKQLSDATRLITVEKLNE